MVRLVVGLHIPVAWSKKNNTAGRPRLGPCARVIRHTVPSDRRSVGRKGGVLMKRPHKECAWRIL